MRRFTVSLLAGCVALVFGLANAEAGTAKDVVRAYVDAINAHDFEAFALTIDEEMVSHGLFGVDGPIRGRDGYVMITAGNFAAFPDAHIEVNEMIAEGNLVAVRWTVNGTHTEPLGEVPATGKPVSVDALALFRIEGGRVVEKWYRQDDLGMFEQLGIGGGE